MELLKLKLVGNTTKELTPEREPQVGRGMFGVHPLILHFQFQFSKSIKLLTFHFQEKEKTNSGYKHNSKVSHGIFNQEIIKVREGIHHIGPLTNVIRLKLFLDTVPSSSEDITHAMRGQPKRLSRIT